MCRITDPYESLVLSVLSQLLVDGPASPFYQALLDSKIGSDYSPMTGLVMVVLCDINFTHVLAHRGDYHCYLIIILCEWEVCFDYQRSSCLVLHMLHCIVPVQYLKDSGKKNILSQNYSECTYNQHLASLRPLSLQG